MLSTDEKVREACLKEAVNGLLVEWAVSNRRSNWTKNLSVITKFTSLV